MQVMARRIRSRRQRSISHIDRSQPPEPTSSIVQALGIAAHTLEDVAAQQTVGGRQAAIDPLKLLQRVSQQLR